VGGGRECGEGGAFPFHLEFSPRLLSSWLHEEELQKAREVVVDEEKEWVKGGGREGRDNVFFFNVGK
jgi:hypothetical protein